MTTEKMSLANIKGKLSRTEMKSIMAGGNEGAKTYKCCKNGSCSECFTQVTCAIGATKHEC